MIPVTGVATDTVIACPHTRGDDPIRNNELARAGILVPTRVGMIL